MPKSKKTKAVGRKAKPKGVKAARKPKPRRINGVGTGIGNGESPGLIGAMTPGTAG